MRQVSCCFFLLLVLSLLSVTQVVRAEDSATTAKKLIESKTLAAHTAPGRSSGGRPTMVNAHYYLRNEAGVAKLRLVIELTGPVKVEASVATLPSPQLVITAKGASVGGMHSPMTLDGKIARKAVFSNIGANGQVKIALPCCLNDDDYKVFTLPSEAKGNKPNRIVVDINQGVFPVSYNLNSGLKGKVIVLDPGHGGSDPGAIGPNGLKEKTVTFAVALKVRALLGKAGARVVLTRWGDRDVYGPNASAVDELRARSNIGNTNKADVFLSIHCNSFPDSRVGGVTSYYYEKSRYDSLLAQQLQEELASGSSLTDRGISAADFYVLRHTVMPASLVELGFISNPNNEQLLRTPQFQQRLAEGIVRGLDDFFKRSSKVGGG